MMSDKEKSEQLENKITNFLKEVLHSKKQVQVVKQEEAFPVAFPFQQFVGIGHMPFPQHFQNQLIIPSNAPQLPIRYPANLVPQA
mmetsp:Transcript_27342/g.20488  ORF Transcript_27342/g.20488 Transcript_27342/m.20488 type:complete len:85 (-) Transcript_27342:232-486(-)